MNALQPILDALRAADGGSIEIEVAGERPMEESEDGEEGEEGESETGAEVGETDDEEVEGANERRTGYNRAAQPPADNVGPSVRDELMKAMG